MRASRVNFDAFVGPPLVSVLYIRRVALCRVYVCVCVCAAETLSKYEVGVQGKPCLHESMEFKRTSPL